MLDITAIQIQMGKSSGSPSWDK